MKKLLSVANHSPENQNKITGEDKDIPFNIYNTYVFNVFYNRGMKALDSMHGVLLLSIF